MGVWNGPASELSPEELEKRKKINKVLAPIVIVLFAFLGLILALSGDDGSPDDPIKEHPDATAAQAYIATMGKIKPLVEKAYPGASFPLIDYKHDYIKNNEYIIISYIEYKNQWGVKNKYYYKVRIKYNEGKKEDPDSWTLVYLEDLDASLY